MSDCKDCSILKTAALIFGAVMLIVGILGFIPTFTPNGHLLGLFHVNEIHNVIHLATGAVGIVVGLTTIGSSRLYFQVFGIIYALVALLGLYYGDRPILNIIANNMADVILHIAIAALSLYLGFVQRDQVLPEDRSL